MNAHRIMGLLLGSSIPRLGVNRGPCIKRQWAVVSSAPYLCRPACLSISLESGCFSFRCKEGLVESWKHCDSDTLWSYVQIAYIGWYHYDPVYAVLGLVFCIKHSNITFFGSDKTCKINQRIHWIKYFISTIPVKHVWNNTGSSMCFPH